MNIDLNSSSPDTPENLIITIICGVHLISTFLISLLLLLSFSRQKQLAIDTQLIFCISISNFIFITTLVVFFIIDSIANVGFSTGAIGCFLEVFILIIAAATMSFFNILLTAYRYLTVTQQVDVLRHSVTSLIVFGTITIVTVCSCFLFSTFAENGLIIQVRPIYFRYCMPSFTSRRAINILFLLLLVSVTILTLLGFIISYLEIIFLFKKLFAKKNTEERQVKEHLLIKKAICITSAYAVCWIPYISMILYEIISGTPVLVVFDILASVLVSLNPAINAVVLYFFDANIRYQIRLLFGLQMVRKPSKTKDIIAVPDNVKVDDADAPIFHLVSLSAQEAGLG